VYVGSNDSKLYAFNSDGTVKWSYQTGGSITRSPAVASNGTVYIWSGDNLLYAINSNGTLKWTFPVTTTTGSIKPAIGGDGTIYVGSADHKLYAVNPDGTLKWTYLTNGISGGNGVAITPSIGSDGAIYVASSGDYYLYAINPDGTLKWTYLTEGVVRATPTVASDGTIYIELLDTGQVYALKPDGTLKWKYDRTSTGGRAAAAIASDGTLYMGAQDGTFYAFRPDGTLKWSIDTWSTGINAKPAIGSDGTIYAGTADSRLLAINPDGTIKGSYKTGGNMAGQTPAIGSDGTVYAGSVDSKIYAFTVQSGYSQDPMSNWRWRNPLPDGNDLNGLAYGNGKFVAVGSYGRIYTSTDKITWTKMSISNAPNLNDVAFGNGIFVTVGGGKITYSTDGLNWGKQSNNWASGVTFANGLFVAVGGDYIYTTSDGFTLNSKAIGSNIGLNKVGYGNGMFVAFGHGNGRDTIFTSPDGVTWTQRYEGSSGNGGLGGFAYGNGEYVISGWNDAGGVTITSSDGVNWTKHVPNTPWNGITFAAGKFMFVNDWGISTSQDGITWTQQQPSGIPTGHGTSALLYEDGAYVAVGPGGSIIFSQNGISWTAVRSGYYDAFTSIAYGNNTFVAGSYSGRSYTSSDGVSWTGKTTRDFNGITFNNGMFTGVGWSRVSTSPDGVNWTDHQLGISNALNGVTYGNGKYVAVGETGLIFTSPDTITWTQSTSNSSVNLKGVAYGNGTYVAVGDMETILTSSDGITWAHRDTSFAASSSGRVLGGITYGAGLFVISGDWSVGMLTSPDGINWAQSWKPVNSGNPVGVGYYNNTFVTVGYNGTMLTSQDGLAWLQNRIYGNALNAVAYGRGTFVIVGAGGTIMQSGAMIPQSTLTVTKTGTGSGTVTSSATGITCGSACTASFNQGTIVILTATPDTGKVFSGWSGGCTGTGTCTVTLNSNTGVTATFGDNSDTTPPVVTITSPTSNATLNKLFFITGTSSDDKSGVTKVELQVTNGTRYLAQDLTFSNTSTWIPITGPLDKWTFGSGTVNWTSGTSYTIRAKATDGAGNVSNIASASFTYVSVAEQAYTTLSLDLSSQTIRQNETVTVTGKLSRLPEIGSNLSGNSVIVSVTDPNGTIRTYPTTTYNSTGFYTAAISGFNLKGGYIIQTSFGGSATLAGSISDSKPVMVGSSAGYAIIIEGKLTNNEGITSHNKTLNRVYRQLKARGFLDDNIYYFNYNTNQPGITVDAVPTKAAIQAAIQGSGPFNLKDKLNGSPATTYIVMVNHGDVNQFHLGNETITPTEMNQWLTTLESGLNANAQQEKRVVIIGACYSGSFISKLSKSGRVLITSAKANEESYKGSVEPDGIRSGEYFIESLFLNFGRSSSIKQAFSQATLDTSFYTKQGGTSPNTGGGSPADKAKQHPLLDDNGDGIGSNDLDATDGDGTSSQSLYVGVGATYVTNASNNPATITNVTDTTILTTDQTSATLWLTVNDDSLLSTSPWMEIRSPSVQLSSTASSNQLEIDLPRAFLTFNEGTNRWEFISSAFSDSGMYEIYYYVQDQATQTVSTMKRSVVYKNKSGSSSPTTFSLTSPTDLSEQKTMLLLDWQDSSDTDTLTYTLLVSKDSTFATVDYKQEEIPYSEAAIDASANLSDLTTYYWKVQAIDSYGNISNSSQSWSFKTNNTNGLPGMITGYVRDNATGSPVTTATITLGLAASEPVMPNGAYLKMASTTGATTLTAKAAGYTDKIVNLTLTPGTVVNNTVYLTSAGTTPTQDTTPPTLTLSTLANGATTTNPTLNVAGTASDNSSVKSVTINNQPVTVTGGAFSFPITLTEGPNTITTIATDNANNTTTDTRTITLDRTAPVMAITLPADNSTTNKTYTELSGTVDDQNAAVTAKVNSGTNTTATKNGTNFSATLNLASGMNTIDITATDPTGNSSNAKRTVTSDTTSPTLNITNPAQDTSTALNSITITGTVTDAVTSATISITYDGQTYTPTVTNNSFSQTISLTSDKTYAITVTATDQAGNKATVQRNIIKLPKTKIFLGANDTFTISSSGTTLYGNTGNNTVTITTGTTGVTLDQNIGRINLPSPPASYKFKQTGNIINVYDTTDNLIVSAPVQGDTDGTQLSFNNGTATAETKLTSGIMTLGGKTVTATPTTLNLNTTNTTPPSTTTTKAKVYLGTDNSFTVSNSGTTLYGSNTGTGIITINTGMTNITLDQNIGQINLPNTLSSYKFKQTGNIINVYDTTGAILVIKIPVQGDADGTILSFGSQGITSAKLTGGVMTLGGVAVNSTEAIAISVVLQ
jgi:outer membrane protein assembly factor BamB